MSHPPGEGVPAVLPPGQASPWALRLFYFFTFAGIGVYLPLLPRWLEARGIEGLAMGVISATVPAMGLVSPPAFGVLADSLGLRGWVLRAACAGGFLAFGFIALSAARGAELGFGALFLAVLVFSFFRAPIIPMADVVALELTSRTGTTYGSLRLWGSIGFTLMALAAGAWLDPEHPAALPAVVASVCLLMFAVAFALPARAPRPPRPVPDHVWALLRSPDFRFLFAASFLGQCAHAAYDLCFSLHLRDLGVPSLTGVAWAVGVIAEIALMAFAGRKPARVAPPLLLAIAFGGASARWALLAVVRSPAALLALQPLHALSFALMWLASVAYVKERAPSHVLATAQGLFMASISAGSVIGMVLWGRLYGRAGGGVTFGAASFVSALAFALAVGFSRSARSGPSSVGGTVSGAS